MNTVTIESEWARREELINSESFRLKAIEFCKQLGISAQEWNQNKAGILMYLANEACKIQNEIGK